MAPLSPCALVSRPMRSCWGRFASATSVVGVDDVDPDPAAVGEGGHDGAQRLRGATRPPDDTAEVLGVHVHLEDLAACARRGDDLHLVRVIDDSLDEVLE